MVINDLNIKDEILNPFNPGSENHVFLTVDKASNHVNNVKPETGKAFITFLMALSEEMVVMERGRYTVWELLGDIGGFYDGIILTMYIFMAPYTALAFMNKLADGTII